MAGGLDLAQARRVSGGMISQAFGGSISLMNFHNQGISRAEYQGGRGSGFAIEFVGTSALRNMSEAMSRGAVMIRGISIASVVETTDETKQALRTFFDAHFAASELHGNDHRRASNAAAQSIYYNDEDQSAFSGLIYSKLGRGKGPDDFVDYLLLHLRGGTIRPKQGRWLRLVNPDAVEGADRRPRPKLQVGTYRFTGSEIFWAKSKDKRKIFQIRRRRNGQTELLATLMRSISIPASLGSLDQFLQSAGARFYRHFDDRWKEVERVWGSNGREGDN